MLPTPPSSQSELNNSQEPPQSTGAIMTGPSSNYRIGLPKPLRPLPLKTEGPSSKSSACKVYLTIQNDLHVELRRANVSGYDLSLVKRYEPGDTPTDEDHTILIHTTKQDGWDVALEAIHGLLQQTNVPNLRVEIMDNRAIQHFWLPKVDDAFRAEWPRVEAQVLGVLGRGCEWETLSVFNQGYTETDSSPTVTIGVTKAADATWRAMMYQRVRELLQSFPTFEAPEVAFVRSSLPAAEFNSSGMPLLPDTFTRRVPMGSSIGVNDKSGTLGGYVTVRYQGQDYVMGLTNHHVISTEDMTDGKIAGVFVGLPVF